MSDIWPDWDFEKNPDRDAGVTKIAVRAEDLISALAYLHDSHIVQALDDLWLAMNAIRAVNLRDRLSDAIGTWDGDALVTQRHADSLLNHLMKELKN